MGTRPDEIRQEISQTRAELTGDVDRLAERTSPSRIARRRAARVRAAARTWRERVMGVPTQAAQTGRQAAHQTAETGRQAAHQVAETGRQAVDAVASVPAQAARTARGNPMAAGLIAFGAGLLAASVIPETRAEREARATGQGVRGAHGRVAEGIGPAPGAGGEGGRPPGR
ncbi:DUF3618 domain-containing protein [Nonomuraea dietziae]|uniref:DUF3618 domain-containing protein n=1 Tax=Nonomuraea dietziae TaxID=65515 RepID=UPI0031D02F3B